jgi:hypothetical protein
MILLSSEDYLAPTKLKGLDFSIELDNIAQSLYPLWSNWIITQLQLQVTVPSQWKYYFAQWNSLNDN